MRRSTAFVFVAVALWAEPAFGGEPNRATCIDAHAQAQVLRRDGKLRAAREQLVLCATPDCPRLVSDDCTTWLNEIGNEMPSVVIAARQAGHEIGAGRGLVDS